MGQQKFIYRLLFVLSFTFISTSLLAQEESLNPFEWEAHQINLPEQLNKAQFGITENQIVAIEDPDQFKKKVKIWNSRFDLDDDWQQFVLTFEDDINIHQLISYEERLIMVGTSESETRIIELLPDNSFQNWEFRIVSVLNKSLINPVAVLWDQKIYLAGTEQNQIVIYQMDLKQEEEWKLVNSIQGIDNNSKNLLTVQSDGEDDAIFLLNIAQNEVGELKHWKIYPDQNVVSLKSPPNQIDFRNSFPVGLAFLGYISTDLAYQQDSKDYLYHTITNTWQEWQPEIKGKQNTGFFSNGQIFIVSSSQNKATLNIGRLNTTGTGLRLSDTATFTVYFVLLLGMGYFFSRRTKTTDDYFRGGKRVPAWAAGISIVATKLSAITFMSIPAKVFATDWTYFLIPFNAFVLLVVVIKVILPFFHRLDLTSAYEYLEKRFNVAVRLIGSATYLLWELGRVGVMLLLPSIVVAVVTDLDLYTCVAMIGIIATIYTLMGGIEAVIWTDVVQVIVMVGGVFVALFIIINQTDGSIAELYREADLQGKLKAFNWNFSLTEATVWVIALGWLGRIQEYVAVQSIVQRFISTENEKAAAKSMWTSALIGVPIVIIFFVVGTALFLFYQHKPEQLNPAMVQADALLPGFFIKELPQGVSGLVIAAIFAAAMSSLDSAINSMSTVVVTDFYKRFNLKVTDAKSFRLAKWLTGIFGVLGTGSALIIAGFEIQSLFDQLMIFMGLIGGGLAGMFLLGMLTRKANSMGVITGFVCSGFIQYYVSKFTDLHFLLYAVTGLFSSILIGYLVSLLFPSRDREKEKYAIRNIKSLG